MWVPAFTSDAPLARRDGLFVCLEPRRAAEVEPFLAQYRRVREQDGYRADRSEYYRALPDAPADDPQRGIWRIRRRSFDRVRQAVQATGIESGPAVLDLGAGCGWLSYQLARFGCRSVAVDLLADDRDGLGAVRHYDVPFTCVQADFDALPFAPRQFDLVIFNGSLHYSPDAAATLRRVERMLTSRGVLLVVDSPTFADRADGEAMRERHRDRLRREYRVAAPIEPGEGFLTFQGLADCAREMGRRVQFFQSHAGWRPRLRRLLPRRLAGSRPARFGVWVAA